MSVEGITPEYRDMVETPKLYTEVSIDRTLVESSEGRLRALEIITDKLPEGDLKDALCLAVEERRARMQKGTLFSTPNPQYPGSERYAYRAAVMGPEDDLEEVDNNLYKLGIEDPLSSPKYISPCLPLDKWLFPKSTDLAEGRNITMLMAYENKDFGNPRDVDASGNVHIHHLNSLSDSRMPSEKAITSLLPTLSDIYIGAIRVNWVEPPSEEDVAIDHGIASALNALVDEGYVTATQLSHMTEEMYQAFMVRFAGKIFAGGLDDRYKRKAGLIFSGAAPRSSEKKTKREHTLEMMRAVMPMIQREVPELEGMLLFGSSMLPDSDVQFEYPPHEPRDIDTCPIFRDARNNEKTRRKFLGVGNSFLKDLYPDENLALETVEFRNPGEFLRILLSENTQGIPLWAWRPSIVRFIGELECKPPFIGPDGIVYTKLDETLTNLLLQQYLNSPRMRVLKSERMIKIREYVKRF